MSVPVRVVGRLNTVNDPAIGGQPLSIIGTSPVAGQLGQRVRFGYDELILGGGSTPMYDPTVGTLFAGEYQYVRFAAGATAAPARGLICFWDTSVAENLYQVTNDEPTGVSLIAGICLNAVTKGNYGWIQVCGLATVKARAALTKAGAVGDLMLAAAAGAGADVATMDNQLDATALTSVLVRHLIGIAQAAPANGALSTVHLKHLCERF